MDHPGLKKMSLIKSLQKYAFGQLLSAILAATGLINGWLFEKKTLNIPAVQAALTYSLILVGSSVYLILEGGVFGFMKEYKGILLGAALFDVAANWLVVKAFSELKIPEVMVFSGVSTPAAILMALIWSHPAHRPKYTHIQIMGILIALTAILFYFWISQRDVMTESVMGIGCALFSAIAYAASNNFQERVAQVMRPVEFLFGLGSIGSLAAWSIVLVCGRHEVEQVSKLVSTDWTVVALIILYAIILSSFYFLIPVYMSRHSAVSFNFSLLTANFLGIMASWWLLDATYSKWVYVCILVINGGILLYYIGEEEDSVTVVKSNEPKEKELLV